jgi:hypothetical protein
MAYMAHVCNVTGAKEFHVPSEAVLKQLVAERWNDALNGSSIVHKQY